MIVIFCKSAVDLRKNARRTSVRKARQARRQRRALDRRG